MKTSLLMALFAVVLLVERHVWINLIDPFFWSPEVAYTDLAWGYIVFGMLFIMIPCGIIGKAIEINQKD